MLHISSIACLFIKVSLPIALTHGNSQPCFASLSTEVSRPATVPLRPGGGFGGPIRSRLVGDSSLPDESNIVLAPQRSQPPEVLARHNSWRPGAEGTTPPERWNGTLVSCRGLSC